MQVKKFVSEKMNLAHEFLRKVCRKSFLKAHVRYFSVLAFFIFAFFYNLVIIPGDINEENDSQEKDEKEQTAVRPPADLDAHTLSRTYGGRCSLAAPGEYYRATFVIDSNRDERVHVSVRSVTGEVQDVGDINLHDTRYNFASLVFQSDYFCRDVIVERVDISDSDAWDDVRIAITQLSFSPVRVTSKNQMDALDPSLLSTLYQENIPISSMIGGGSTAKQLSLKGGQIGNDIESEGEFVTGIWVRPDLSSASGSGNYAAEVLKYVGKESHFDLKKAFSNKFSIQDLSQFETNEEGWYKIPLEGALQKGETYLVGIKSEQTQSGEGEYLHLLPFDAEDGIDQDDIFFVLDAIVPQTFKSDGEVSDTNLVPGSILEDRGDAYTYEYALKNDRGDILSIDAASDNMEYDEGRHAIVMDSNKDAWYSYKFNVLHDVRKVYIEAAQLGSREAELILEYSWNGDNWHEIPYEQKEGGSQVFRGTFTADKKDIDAVYVRIRHALNEKSSARFGLQSLRVSVEMEK